MSRKITGIRILNYLGIEALVVDDLGKFNKIIGANEVGKSAVLEAIREAFKSSGVDPNLIRIGEDESEIMIEIDHSIIVERSIKEGSNKVKVTDGGLPIKKPQTYLDDLIGPFIFRPVDFFKSRGRERPELLLSAIPFKLEPEFLRISLNWTPDLWEANIFELTEVDYDQHGLDALDDVKTRVYDKRRELGRDVERLMKSIEQDKQDLPETLDGAKFKKFDLENKMEEVRKAEQLIQKKKSLESQIDYRKNTIESLEGDIEDLRLKIAKLQEELKAAILDRDSNMVKLEEFDSSILEVADTVKTEIAAYEQYRTLAHRFEDIERRGEELGKVEEAHKAADDLYILLNNEITKKILGEIDIPIEGLELRNGDIFINNVAIDKLSTSEKMRIGVKIARALAGELKIICLDGYESLDLEVRKAFEEEAADDGFEYFLTIVTGGELAIERS